MMPLSTLLISPHVWRQELRKVAGREPSGLVYKPLMRCWRANIGSVHGYGFTPATAAKEVLKEIARRESGE